MARTTLATARTGVWIYSAFLGCLPLVWWIAPPWSPYAFALTGLVLANIALCAFGARIADPRGKEWLIALTNSALVVVVARMFSPFLIAPALAAMSVMTIVNIPTTSWWTRATGMALCTIAAVLGPWIVERLGWISRTISVDEHGILMRAAGTAGSEAPTLFVAVVYTVAMLGSAAAMANAMRRRERANKRQIMVQAWRLRQLVSVQ